MIGLGQDERDPMFPRFAPRIGGHDRIGEAVSIQQGGTDKKPIPGLPTLFSFGDVLASPPDLLKRIASARAKDGTLDMKAQSQLIREALKKRGIGAFALALAAQENSAPL